MKQRVFDHVLVIMFENEYRSYVMQNDYMRRLAAQGIELTNSFGVMHPSQTNYITSISGELCNVSDDDVPNPFLPQDTIVDLIEASPDNLDWRAYMDGYNPGWTPWRASNFNPSIPLDPKVANDPSLAKYYNYPYVLKHNPFSSYTKILESEARWHKIVNEAAFYRDLLNGDFPQYAWFTPDMWNDGHYLKSTLDNDLKGERAPVLVNQQATWLESFFNGIGFPGPNSKLPPNTLVVVTYDEADFESKYDTANSYKYFYDGPNQIYTVLLGDMIKPGKEIEGYNHYSLLRTIEKNFNLGDLGKNDRYSNWFQFLWGKRFQWYAPECSPIEDAVSIQAASCGDQLLLTYASSDGGLWYRSYDGQAFSQAVRIASQCSGQLALTDNQDGLMLIWRDQQAHLNCQTYSLSQGWSPVSVLNQGAFATGDGAGNDPTLVGTNFSIASLPGLTAIVLVYEDQSGHLHSLRYDNGTWQETANQPHCQSDGPFQLGVLGATLLLMYTTKKNGNLACLSMNTADFNKVSVPESKYGGAYDDTTVDRWSPCGFGISHFSSQTSVLTPEEPEPQTTTYHGEGLLASATLDGVLHLFHNNPNNPQLVTETFSISGTLTPANPVSYNPNPALQTITNNGYGTMAEAGWSQQRALNGAIRDAGTALAATNYAGRLWCFYQAAGSSKIMFCCGRYQ